MAFDRAHYGRTIVEDGGSALLEAFEAWQDDGQQGGIPEFFVWVQQTTGMDPFTFLDEDDVERLIGMCGPDRDAAMSLLEGIGTGP